MTRYAALYCRISKDRRGRYEGVDLQEKQGRAYASAAWPDLPVEVFADNDLSAAKDDVVRPEYERLRQWLRDGRIAAVWCVEQTRLERREVHWFVLAAELDAAGIEQVHTNRDGIVAVRDEVAGIKAVLAAAEVRKMKKRQADRFAENAAQGVPHGGPKIGYRHGVTADGVKTLVIVEEEAEAIRFAAERILAGWSRTRIAGELTGRGMHGVHGGRLDAKTVKDMVTNPTVAGLRVYRGRIVGTGNWLAILDADTYKAAKLKAVGTDQVEKADGKAMRIKRHIAHPGRRYLLTGGRAVCAVCGAALSGCRRNLKKGPVSYYLCHVNNGGRSCVGLRADWLEDYVADRLWAELDKPGFLDQLAADDHAQRREQITKDLDGIEGKRGELAEQWARPGELTSAEWQKARRALAEHEQQLRIELAELPPPMLDVDIATARRSWPNMILDERREFVGLFVEAVMVGKNTTGRRRFDPDRVEIVWRQR